jgi:hypothetical protein
MASKTNHLIIGMNILIQENEQIDDDNLIRALAKKTIPFSKLNS